MACATGKESGSVARCAACTLENCGDCRDMRNNSCKMRYSWRQAESDQHAVMKACVRRWEPVSVVVIAAGKG